MTVAELIRSAFRTLGVLASEEAPRAAEQADGLVTLNDLLDSWAGEHLALFATLRSVHPLTPGLSPHTIGTGGDIDTTRPVRIDRASVESSAAPGSGTPLRILSESEWQHEGGKDTVGTPSSLWIETSYPLLQLHLRPVPNVADNLVLYTWQQLGRFTSVFADFDFPPGYARALRFNLAKELAPEYGVTLSAEAADVANESKSTLKRLNAKPTYLRCDAAVLQGYGYNLISGEG